MKRVIEGIAELRLREWIWDAMAHRISVEDGHPADGDTLADFTAAPRKIEAAQANLAPARKATATKRAAGTDRIAAKKAAKTRKKRKVAPARQQSARE